MRILQVAWDRARRRQTQDHNSYSVIVVAVSQRGGQKPLPGAIITAYSPQPEDGCRHVGDKGTGHQGLHSGVEGLAQDLALQQHVQQQSFWHHCQTTSDLQLRPDSVRLWQHSL